jgi:LysR family transcriptional regulator, glycine cleavage system transcriptional activator
MKVSRNKRLPPVANMEAFLAVARSRSVTVAAEELFLTQGAVSRQILDLEKFVGTSLFSRGPRGLELTTAGQQLVAKMQPLLAQLEDVFVSLTSPGRETLNVSITPSLGLEVITREVHAFLKDNPTYLVNFFTRVGDVDVEEEEGLDAAVVSGEPRSKGGHPELLCSPPLYAYASTDLLAGDQAAGIAALYQHKLIGQMRHTHAWPEYFERLGLVFSPDMIGANHSMLSAAAHAALNGTGIALLPDFIAHRHVLEGKLRRISETAYVPQHSSYFLISKKSVRERPIYVKFRAWLVDLCRTIDKGEPPLGQ